LVPLRVELDVVGGPSSAELPAARGQLADEVGETSVVEGGAERVDGEDVHAGVAPVGGGVEGVEDARHGGPYSLLARPGGAAIT
jgi:hypothetical protein